ncbi:MAG: hypothetical protein C4315_05320 [Chloroflexota bacterium]
MLKNARFEVLFEVTLWGNIKGLREMLTLAESDQLTPIGLKFYPLAQFNEVQTRHCLRRVTGRAVPS